LENNVVYYPLTHPQIGIWYTEKLYPGTSMGNISATVRLKEGIDYPILEKAINKFIEKNDGIRLRFTEIDYESKQYISEYKYVHFDFFDFSNSGTDELYKWDSVQKKIPFNLIDCNLFYFALIKVNDSDGGYFIKIHHLISDAWTMVLLTNSILEYYTLLKNGESICENMKPSYLEYILKEEEYKKTLRYEKDKQYWSTKLQDWHEITTIKVRKSNTLNAKAKRRTFQIPRKLADKIHAYCSENGFSEYTIFLSALYMYINRITAKEDIVLGTTLLNRSNAREKDTAGLFASTAVPIRININGDMSFSSFIEYISREILTLFKHQKYSYDLIIKQIRENNNTIDKIFDIVLTYQNAKLKKNHSIKCDTRWHFSGYQIESLIININDREDSGILIIDYDYLSDVFNTTEIEFIHQHIISLLWHALDNPNKEISKFEMLSELEKQKILCQFNNTSAEYNRDITIHELFEEQVKKTPENTAVIFNNKKFTYSELNVRANQLARKLRKIGIKRDEIVGVMDEKSFEMIVALLAVMKAGGAYLPLDPDYPEDRLDFMLADSSSRILLTRSQFIHKTNFTNAILLLDKEETYQEDPSNLENINKPNDILYIIYTSGSTGNPKAVMIEHRNVVRLLFNNKFQFQFNGIDVWTLFHSLCFDFSVWEMYGALLYGGSLVVIPKSIARDSQKFLQILKEYNVTVLNQTPAAFYNLIYEEMKHSENDLGLRYVIFGGEALKPSMLKNFQCKYPDTKLINMYGITETTVHVTFKELSAEDVLSSRSNIGKPLPTLTMYIMDKNLNLLPIGIPGEICVGGDGVARGYFNRLELTEKKFVINPYNPSERLYRSGDLGRWYAKGDVEYLGRIDNQVKIRGYRVELGEIEKKLLNIKSIKDAVVTTKTDKSEKNILLAYVVYEEEIPVSQIRSYLMDELPDYMVPAHYIRMDKLPLTPNGKVDKNQLPEPEFSNTETQYIPPRNEIEKELSRVWSDILEVGNIGINNNFFEFGGDSLAIIQLLTRVYKNNWGISAADLYEYPTIMELADKIKGVVREDASMQELDIASVVSKEETDNPDPDDDKHENVLLTGVTGFLGIHVLSQLIEQTRSAVYCLVRGKNDEEAGNRLLKSLHFYFANTYDGLIGKRVFAISGDITKFRFGLTCEQYAELGGNINTVIHAAALVKYFGNYNEFEEINVNGTKKIIDFSCEFGAKLEYISTIGISGSYLVKNGGSNLTLTENDFYIGQNYLDNAYVRSKFEAENLVLKAIRQGLTASIYRMGNLTARYSDGHFQHNADDNAFCNIIKSLMELKAIPDNSLDLDVEFTPVDLASKALLLISRTRESASRIFHITNHNLLYMQDMLEIFKSFGIELKILNSMEFEKYIEAISCDKVKEGMLAGIINDISTTRKLDYLDSIKVDSQITSRYLNHLGFEWPTVDKRYIVDLIKYLQETGYLSDANMLGEER